MRRKQGGAARIRKKFAAQSFAAQIVDIEYAPLAPAGCGLDAVLRVF
jgi:hypothetical protein